LFIYVLVVAFLFVRILGAEVIGDADGKTKKKKKGEPPPGEAMQETMIGEAIGGAH
jgi:trehalose/maltose transport system permease protein